MLSDIFYKFKGLFCHHEYVYQSVPELVHLWYGYWYRCGKCGRIAYNPPQELIVSEEDKQN